MKMYYDGVISAPREGAPVAFIRKGFFALCLMLSLCLSFAFGGEIASTPRVLFLSSYSLDWPSSFPVISAFREVLSDKAIVRYVFLDTKTYPYEATRDGALREIETYQDEIGRFSYVFVSDDQALDFVLEHSKGLFADAKVVFTGINSVDRAEVAAQDPQITGVVEFFPLEETVKLAKRLMPNATQVVAISDDSVSGRGSSRQFMRVEDEFPDLKFEVFNTSQHTKTEIAIQLGQYDDSTILIMLMFSDDKDGNLYTMHDGAAFLHQYASIPIFRTDELGIGCGLFGGIVISYGNMARQASRMLLEAMEGADMSTMPIEQAVPFPLFDLQLLTTYHISKGELPVDAVYINDPPSFLEEHEVVLVPSFIILFSVLFIFFLLLFYVFKRRRFESRIQEKDIVIDSLLNNMPGGAVIYHISPTMTRAAYVSDGLARLLGIKPVELNQPENPNLLNSYVHSDETQMVNDALAENTAKKLPVRLQFRMRTSEGGWIWVLFNAVYIRDEGDEAIYYAIFLDISAERKVLQSEQDAQRAEGANAAKTEFLSTVSHDMRTPLNGILGLASLLQDERNLDTILSGLKQIEHSGQYLLNLINDTLDVNRIESGNFELHPCLCNGQDILANVCQLLNPLLEQKQIEMKCDLRDDGKTWYYADMRRIEQVLVNLIGNACKFSLDGGSIDFQIEQAAKKENVQVVRFRVKDYGIGMSAEFLPHIFEPFSQENGGTTTRTSGTGLGMTITQQIIRQMHGDIFVESVKGKGSTFTFMLELPIATPAQIASGNSKNDNMIALGSLSGLKVILAEDHALNMTIATRMLEKVGVIITPAVNGRECVDLFVASPYGSFDAILMDIRMPLLDGIEATRCIRVLDRPDAKTVPIIAMTANAFDSDKEECQKAGMNDHLAKPISRISLYAILEKNRRR